MRLYEFAKSDKDNQAAPDAINKELDAQGITDPYVRNSIQSKFGQESGSRPGSVEIPYRNTDNDRIRLKLPQLSRMSDDELNTLKSDDRAFFNRAYGGMLGNTGKDDGYIYRGRGLTGTTGKANYAAASQALFGDDRLVKNPDLILDPETDRRSAVWFYKNAGADKVSFKNQTEADQWAIYKAGGRAYAPGTKLGDLALANMQNKGSRGTASDLTQLASNAVNTVKNTASDAVSTVRNTASDIYRGGIDAISNLLPNPIQTAKNDEEIEIMINGVKKKFKNRQEALAALALAKQQGKDVAYV